MTRLVGALLAGVLAFSPAPVLADDNDMNPLSTMGIDEAKAARAAAKAKWDKMTPDEQAAVRKVARNKKLRDATALEMIADESMMLGSPSPRMGDFWSPNDPMYRKRTIQDKPN